MSVNQIEYVRVHCSNLDHYSVVIKRKNVDGDGTYYRLNSESRVFDYLSKLINDGKLSQRVQLSVYPSLFLKPTSKLKKKVTKANYDGAQARIELTQSIRNALENVYTQIAMARKNEMSFADNEEVNPQDFDNLFHVIGAVFRECDRISIEAGAEDEYGYTTQKNFD